MNKRSKKLFLESIEENIPLDEEQVEELIRHAKLIPVDELITDEDIANAAV